jgi:hypothetical protein
MLTHYPCDHRSIHGGSARIGDFAAAPFPCALWQCSSGSTVARYLWARWRRDWTRRRSVEDGASGRRVGLTPNRTDRGLRMELDIDRRERIARRAHEAAAAAALRAEAARQRREEARRRVLALRQGGSHGLGSGLTAAERAAAAAHAVEVARVHADEAMDRSASAHDASARAHERAAGTAETLGRVVLAAQHRDAACLAREAAARDREAAHHLRPKADTTPPP